MDHWVENVEALLERFAHFGVDLGLERIERLLENLGNPHQHMPVLHVAGSNGKGSVCAYLSAVLTYAGYRVGRYTSPHLVDWCERICINEQPIAPAELHHLLLRVIAAIQPDYPSPTQFEVITAAAWLYFAECQVDVAVIEVGLGGRLDATNVCDRPLASIITSLSREHWQRLGPTLADIAREKAGILKPGCPAILAAFPPDAEGVVQQRATDLTCPTYWIEPSRDLGDGWAEYTGMRMISAAPTWCYPLKYQLPLPGAHQLSNSALAITALQLLQSQGWAIDSSTIAEGMAKTRWFARLQWITWEGRSLLIDGAHNPAGAIALRHYIDHNIDHNDNVHSPIGWVMGMLANKDHADVFQALLRPGDRLYLVPVPDHASADLDELTTLALKSCPELAECRSCATVLEGLQASFQGIDAEGSGGTTILCGSLYLIGDFFRTIQPVV
ncbi:MAG: folylpolyglutamate synthase/dihydrofolate synthase family protein [Oculatellaceae cyanobacterium bins.114]|nr:folylpolyglutamate synthase/dihydrofolate synthase family protein [Oculatellaceae cyanobacterium bins.114]